MLGRALPAWRGKPLPSTARHYPAKPGSLQQTRALPALLKPCTTVARVSAAHPGCSQKAPGALTLTRATTTPPCSAEPCSAGPYWHGVENLCRARLGTTRQGSAHRGKRMRWPALLKPCTTVARVSAAHPGCSRKAPGALTLTRATATPPCSAEPCSAGPYRHGVENLCRAWLGNARLSAATHALPCPAQPLNDRSPGKRSAPGLFVQSPGCAALTRATHRLSLLLRRHRKGSRRLALRCLSSPRESAPVSTRRPRQGQSGCARRRR